ncbi:MAG: MBOAT family protein [Verrucomicrobiota bacterium]
MLFNSYIFLFVFFPITWIGYFSVRQWWGHRASMTFIALASLFFYGWWNPLYLGLIIPLLIVNYGLGKTQNRYFEKHSRGNKPLLVISIIFNLGVLGYYKYLNFFVDNVNAWTDFHWVVGKCILPLGISFFTFQKIGYLMDCYRGESQKYHFVDFCCFVLFFPQLIAGPIVHHSEFIPQLQKIEGRPNARNIAIGITFLVIGLVKKTFIADGLSPYVRSVFDFIQHGGHPSMKLGWSCAIAYTLQLYFDFSGYSDMAIGLARMFNIRFPANFNSPYKALSIVDFWRRWHMTLSRFLRDYLYISLGGNRCGVVRQKINLILTMLLGGLWHGAAWTFVVWGGMHGLYLTLNHTWTGWTENCEWKRRAFYRFMAWGFTFFAVMLAWIVFRAASLHDAWVMMQGMMGFHGFSNLAELNGIPGKNRVIAMGLIVALFMPNTQQLFYRFEPVLGKEPSAGIWEWRPSPAWAIGAALLAVLGILQLSSISEFIYFQF